MPSIEVPGGVSGDVSGDMLPVIEVLDGLVVVPSGSWIRLVLVDLPDGKHLAFTVDAVPSFDFRGEWVIRYKVEF